MSLWKRYKAWATSLSTRGKLLLIVGGWMGATCVGVAVAFVYLAWSESRPVPVPESLSYHLQTEHLTIHTDLSEPQARHYATFFEGFYDHFSANYFPLDQPKPLVMLLFGDPDGYTRFCSKIGHVNSTFGFYMGPRKNTIVVNFQNGLGTVSHELVHHFLALGNIDHHPDWVNEGIPAFFEKFMGHVDDSGKLHVSFGYFSNWRFPITKALIENVSLADLFSTQEQGMARSFTLFLHKNGELKSFVKALHQAGPDGDPVDVLNQVLQKPLSEIEREWKDWVMNQPIDAQVKLVPASFIKTQAEWNSWWDDNRGRLSWDDTRKIYVTSEEDRNGQGGGAKHE